MIPLALSVAVHTTGKQREQAKAKSHCRRLREWGKYKTLPLKGPLCHTHQQLANSWALLSVIVYSK